jgi:ADP-L-glycero-D-manno-heptose 6-epimerase
LSSKISLNFRAKKIRPMIILTGAAGFIGSNFLAKLNKEGVNDIVLVDDFTNKEKEQNYLGKNYVSLLPRDELFGWMAMGKKIDFVFHIGARTDTTEMDMSVFDHLNLNYTKKIWKYCTEKQIPMIYASSAATYGAGEHGYHDDHEIVNKLEPLNPYGISKNEFDKWALLQKDAPPFWAGLKFFNVYGPNEYHKGRMASVIFHTFRQIKETGKMKLFRSHHPDFKDGEQLRDFVYVKDVVDVMWFLSNNQLQSGLFNLGTGKARSFNDLASATFSALGLQPDIEYIDTPEDIRHNYQYFTEAHMQKLQTVGYNKEFYNLESGINDYVFNYLSVGKYI